jgi:small subunit ribosomal protein S20
LAENSSVANTKSAEKAARQAVKHRATNVALRSRLRSAIRKATEATASGNGEAARAGVKSAQPIIDAMANKGLIHRNKAARHKSRLAAKAKAAAGK